VMIIVILIPQDVFLRLVQVQEADLVLALVPVQVPVPAPALVQEPAQAHAFQNAVILAEMVGAD